MGLQAQHWQQITASDPAVSPSPLCWVGAHPARVALQELDLLKELDVVCSKAVQLALQGLDGVLGQAALLWAGGGHMGTRLGTAGLSLVPSAFACMWTCQNWENYLFPCPRQLSYRASSKFVLDVINLLTIIIILQSLAHSRQILSQNCSSGFPKNYY